MEEKVIEKIEEIPEEVLAELSNGKGDDSDDTSCRLSGVRPAPKSNQPKSGSTKHSNSPLVDYTKISSNKTVMTNKVIDTITIHCVCGQCSVEVLGEVFAPTARQASSNYGVGYDGRIGMYVEEKDRAWTSSSRSNDSRAITIEVASDTTAPYAVRDVAFKALIRLLVDICKRNNIKKLLWKNDKSLIGQVNKQNMTVHRWFSNTICPGQYLLSRHDEIADLVNKELEVPDLTKNYKIGKRYKLLKNRRIYTGPGTKYETKKYKDFGPIAKKKDKDRNGAFDKGSKITCIGIKQNGKQAVWLQCKSGWICAQSRNGKFVEEVTKK